MPVDSVVTPWLPGGIMFGIKALIRIYPLNGIIVMHMYDPESSPPRLIERQVSYLEPE